MTFLDRTGGGSSWWRKKRTYSAILVCVAFVVVASLFYVYSSPQNNSLGKLSIEDEIALQESVAGIVKTKNIETCLGVKDEMYRAVCRNNVALRLAEETLNVSYCEYLDDILVSKASCQQGVVFKKSIKEEDVNVCGLLPDPKLQQVCRNEFWINPSVLTGKDVSFCEVAQAGSEQLLCKDAHVFYSQFVYAPIGFDCRKFLDDGAQKSCVALQDEGNYSAASCLQVTQGFFRDFCLTASRDGGANVLVLP